MVEREFQTQQRKIYNDALRKVISGLSNLTKKNIPVKLLKKLSIYQKEIKEIENEILESAESEVADWFIKIDATRIPLCLDQANEALEAYFQGTPPLKNAKIRDDIPDSFIARAIEKIQPDCNELHIIVGDTALRNSFSSSPSIITYKNLAEFVESDLIQDALLEADLLDNYEEIIVAIKSFEDENKVLQYHIANSVGEKIVWKTIYGETIPDDNNEATINMYDEPENIELDFEEAFYFGDGQFGIPFSLKMGVQAYYYIFKSDYFSMQNPPSVSDHNDHYYEAEGDFEVRVEGIAELSIDKKNVNIEEIEESIDIETVQISKITKMELSEPEYL